MDHECEACALREKTKGTRTLVETPMKGSGEEVSRTARPACSGGMPAQVFTPRSSAQKKFSEGDETSAAALRNTDVGLGGEHPGSGPGWRAREESECSARRPVSV